MSQHKRVNSDDDWAGIGNDNGDEDFAGPLETRGGQADGKRLRVKREQEQEQKQEQKQPHHQHNHQHHYHENHHHHHHQPPPPPQPKPQPQQHRRHQQPPQYPEELAQRRMKVVKLLYKLKGREAELGVSNEDFKVVKGLAVVGNARLVAYFAALIDDEDTTDMEAMGEVLRELIEYLLIY